MEEGCSWPAESGTCYLSSRHLDEIAGPMQRRLASLHPSGSVSKNDRRRNRQERSATQQIVTTDGSDHRSWLPFGPAKGLIGAASRQGERKPRSPHWPLPSSHAFLTFLFFFSTPRSHGHNHNPSLPASDPLEPLFTHSTQPTRTDRPLLGSRVVCFVGLCAVIAIFRSRCPIRLWPDLVSTSTASSICPRSVRIRA